jgi:hypothetical protein
MGPAVKDRSRYLVRAIAPPRPPARAALISVVLLGALLALAIPTAALAHKAVHTDQSFPGGDYARQTRRFVPLNFESDPHASSDDLASPLPLFLAAVAAGIPFVFGLALLSIGVKKHLLGLHTSVHIEDEEDDQQGVD